MTVAGPEPLDSLQNSPDRQHYLDKQIQPVAEPVLAVLGLDFDGSIGDNRQMSLFSSWMARIGRAAAECAPVST